MAVNSLTGMGIIAAILTTMTQSDSARLLGGLIAGALGWLGYRQERREREK